MPQLPGVEDNTRFTKINTPKTVTDLGLRLREAEDAAAIRSLDSALLRRRAALNAQSSSQPGPVAISAQESRALSFDDASQDLIVPFTEGPLRGRAEAVLDAHRRAFNAGRKVGGIQAGELRLIQALEGVFEDSREAAALQPDLAEIAKARAVRALDETAALLQWSDNDRNARLAAFDEGLITRMLRAAVERGDPQHVLQELNTGSLSIGGDNTIALRREAETAVARLRSAFESDADAAVETIENGGDGAAALIARARQILPADALQALTVRVHQAESDAAFRADIRFHPVAEIKRAVAGSNGEARKHHQAIAATLLQERREDPAGYAMADPTVAAWFSDDTDLETELSRRLQVQAEMGLPPDAIRTLSQDEARPLTVELNDLPPPALAARFANLRDKYGKHYDKILQELAAHGLDRPRQALAAATRALVLTQRLVQAQTTGREGLRANLSDAERLSVTQAVAASLEPIARGFRFAVEDIAFLNFKQTGDADTAAQDALALTREAFGAEGAEENSATDETPQIGEQRRSIDSSLPSGGQKNSDTEPEGKGVSEDENGNQISFHLESDRTEKFLQTTFENLSMASMEQLEEQGKIDEATLSKLSKIRNTIEKTLNRARENEKIAKNTSTQNAKTSPLVVSVDPNEFGLLAAATEVIKLAIGAVATREISKRIPAEIKAPLKTVDRATASVLMPIFLISSAIDGLRRGTAAGQIKNSQATVSALSNALSGVSKEIDKAKIRTFVADLLKEPNIDPD